MERIRLKFSHQQIDGIPNHAAGVYSIWYSKSNLCLYIGKGEKSIKGRLFDHWAGSHNEHLLKWIQCYGPHLEICYVALPAEKYDTITKLERRLIQYWRPETNKQHNTGR